MLLIVIQLYLAVMYLRLLPLNIIQTQKKTFRAMLLALVYLEDNQTRNNIIVVRPAMLWEHKTTFVLLVN